MNVMVPVKFACPSCRRRVSPLPDQQCHDCLVEDWSSFATHKERVLTESVRQLQHRLSVLESIIRVPDSTT